MESWRAAPGVFWTFVLPGGLWLAVFFLVPLALVWLIAFGERVGPADIELTWTLANYRAALDPLYLGLFVKSFWVALAATAICLVASFPVALALSFAPARLKPIGIGAVSIFYPTCNGDVPEGWYRSSLRLMTSDPNQPEVAYPISCLVDGTPPRLNFANLEPNGLTGWYTRPGGALIWADDPESEDMVESISCTRGEQTFSASGRSVQVSLMPEGTVVLSCTARDLVGNVATVEHTVKVDTRRPSLTSTVSPPMNRDGWSNAASTTVSFACDDPVPGSGVANPPPAVILTEETADTRVDSGECADVAGNTAQPLRVTVRIDQTAPSVTARSLREPNAAGWHREEPAIDFQCAEVY